MITHFFCNLMFQKQRVLRIQGVKVEAVVVYRKPLTTQEMLVSRLSRRVSKKGKFS